MLFTEEVEGYNIKPMYCQVLETFNNKCVVVSINLKEGEEMSNKEYRDKYSCHIDLYVNQTEEKLQKQKNRIAI